MCLGGGERGTQCAYLANEEKRFGKGLRRPRAESKDIVELKPIFCSCIRASEKKCNHY